MKRLIAGGIGAFFFASAALAQSVYTVRSAHSFSAASTNATSVFVGQAALYNLLVINATATVYYLKLYDKATAPTCNTDTVLATYPVPANATNPAPLALARSVPLRFVAGLAFCVTGGSADNDNTNAATGVTINLEYRPG